MRSGMLSVSLTCMRLVSPVVTLIVVLVVVRHSSPESMSLEPA
jgi:hypothetical protein